MSRLQVRFEIDVPDDMPIDAACEWIAFEVGVRCDITLRHPQMNKDMEPRPETFVVWEL
jgi:hypothetical protein